MIPVESAQYLIPALIGLPALATTIIRFKNIKDIDRVLVNRRTPDLGQASVDTRRKRKTHFVQVATGAKATILATERGGGKMTITIDDDASSPAKMIQEATITLDDKDPVAAAPFKVTRITPKQSRVTADVLHMPFLKGFARNPVETFRDHETSGTTRK